MKHTHGIPAALACLLAASTTSALWAQQNTEVFAVGSTETLTRTAERVGTPQSLVLPGNPALEKPALLRLDDGNVLLAAWVRKDAHNTLALFQSDDSGERWKVLVQLPVPDSDEVWAAPRLAQCGEALVLLIFPDSDDAAHDYLPSTVLAARSLDGGKSWTDFTATDIRAARPGTPVCAGKSLLVSAQATLPDSQARAVVLYASEDQGRTWGKRSVVAENALYRAAASDLAAYGKNDALACVIANGNPAAGIPNRVAFSKDHGQTWDEARLMPFAFAAPQLLTLPAGGFAVIGKQNGPRLWEGSLIKEAGRNDLGMPADLSGARFADGVLTLQNAATTPPFFTLPPAETPRREVTFDANVRVEGPAGAAVARIAVGRLLNESGEPLVLHLASDELWLEGGERHSIDLTVWRDVVLRSYQGIVRVYVDDRPVLTARAASESAPMAGKNVQPSGFGGEGATGKSQWRRITYVLQRADLPSIRWYWPATPGQSPLGYWQDRLASLPLPANAQTAVCTLKNGELLIISAADGHGQTLRVQKKGASSKTAP